MKKTYWILTFIFIGISGYFLFFHSSTSSNNIADIEAQYNKTLEIVKDTDRTPRTLQGDGKLQVYSRSNWTSGFFSGCLWYLYELTKIEKWKNEASYWTELQKPAQTHKRTHNIGFKVNCSIGNAYRITNNKEYEQVIIGAAETLSTRFNETVGLTKSMNYLKSHYNNSEWYYPVVISNMMNLELLYYASQLSGNPKYENIATTHALTTMKHIYRNDYSCYQIADFNVETGEILDFGASLGINKESCWARGQAWGLYGFVMCYRYTNDQRFLSFAENIASFIMNNPHIPANNIPYWDYYADSLQYIPIGDFDANQLDEIPVDVSAAVITASALFELSTFVETGKQYYQYADDIIKTVSRKPFCAKPDENNYFYLKNTVYSIHNPDQVNVPAIYSDYYYLEALLRKRKIDKNE